MKKKLSLDLKKRIARIVREMRAAKGKHVPDHPTWWTCFYFEGDTPPDLHCTHKYFGDLEDAAVEEIKELLIQYFDKKPFKPFQITFNKEKMFGPDKDVRVLTPTEYNKDNLLLDLRSKFDKIKEDNYPSYKPHVTTDKELLEKPFKGYALMFGDKKVLDYT
jgi:hypothetical protein